MKIKTFIYFPEEDKFINIEKKEEIEKALAETIIKVKEHSYNVQIDEMDKNDLLAWQKILQEKSKLQKLHISL